MRRAASEKGAVLVETALALFPAVLALCLATEMARRGQIEVALRHGVFTYSRLRAIGAPAARRRAADFLSRALSEEGRRAARPGAWTESVRADGTYVARLHYRFPALLPFPGKHHFEVTARCTFSRS